MFNDDQNASVSPVPVLLQYECMVSDRGSVFEITVFLKRTCLQKVTGNISKEGFQLHSPWLEEECTSVSDMA